MCGLGLAKGSLCHSNQNPLSETTGVDSALESAFNLVGVFTEEHAVVDVITAHR